MTEIWKDIPFFENRYQVSNTGRVKAKSFLQRYEHWRTRQELFRQTKERILAQSKINSGYLIVHLYLDNVRTPFLVHRLAAVAFLPGLSADTVNHKNGVKHDNTVNNLEWATYTENLNHAVNIGLNTRAIRVEDPRTGIVYGSINKATKICHISRRNVLRKFIKVSYAV